MSGWTALVPIKPATERKTRLQPCLNMHERIMLSDAMLRHVLSVLVRSASIGEIVLLADGKPSNWAGRWLADEGRGLNAELHAAAKAYPVRLVVVHADLPALGPEDIAALTGAAESGIAIAPDRHLRGTNALAALESTDLAFAFGSNSFAAHRAAMPRARVVPRRGLGLDVDRPDDLETAIRQGYLHAVGAASSL